MSAETDPLRDALAAVHAVFAQLDDDGRRMLEKILQRDRHMKHDQCPCTTSPFESPCCVYKNNTSVCLCASFGIIAECGEPEPP